MRPKGRGCDMPEVWSLGAEFLSVAFMLTQFLNTACVGTVSTL